MAHLIDKDVLVEEIERQQRRLDILRQSNDVESRKTAAIQNGVYCYILSLLNTSEVKEMDLEKELSLEDYKSFFEKHPDLSDDWGFDEAWIFAKYFFELGLKAQKGE